MAKRGVIDHPKNRRLARQLATFPGVTLGLLETIWHWVAEFRKDGALTLADLEDALDSGGWLQMFSLDQVATAMTNEAKECVWLDDLGDGRFYIHDWHEHAEDNIHNYLARGHKRFANGEMPSLKRLAKDERIALEAHYKQEDLGSSAQKAHGERTESPLPEPKPEPKPIAKAQNPPTPQGTRVFPPPFDGAEFQSAWKRWERYRIEKRQKPWTESTFNSNMKAWGKLPLPVVIQAIDTAIQKGWTGIFPERAQQDKPPPRGITDEVLAEAQRLRDQGGLYASKPGST